VTRTLVCSGLLLVLGLAVSAQPPPDPTKKPPPGTPGGEPLTQPQPPAGSLDAVLAAALKNHPDVRLAEAKRQVAEAELAQAKLAVAQKVTAAHAKVQSARVQVTAAEKDLNRLKALGKHPRLEVPRQQVEQAEAALAAAKANLAAAEAEFRTAAGLPLGTPIAAERGYLDTVARTLAALNRPDDVAERLAVYERSFAAQLLAAAVAKPQPGSATDKLRQLVDKPVALDLKDRVPFDQAMQELLAKSGLGELTVRYPDWASAKYLKDPPTVGPLRGEQTAAGWLQLILDDFNLEVARGKTFPDHKPGKYDVYIREYGLLVTQAELAPPGAVTLADFVRQMRAEKAAEAAKPAPKN
jgi:hypothetical protein